jgi:hypothetical protein
MAEGKTANERAGEGGRRGGRRYFRRRPQSEKEDASVKSQPTNKRRTPERNTNQDRGERGDGRTRLGRRRRRSRPRQVDVVEIKAQSGNTETITNIDDYTPPQSVFVYTHVSRPGGRDNFEFRSEHFSKVGRTLADYNIDVAVLFTEGESLTPIALPKPEANADVEEDDDQEEEME